MKRNLSLVAVLLLLPSLAIAGGVEKDVKSRWLGAWVVTAIETHSDCRGMYTNNRVNGLLVKSRGRNGFTPGELAKVDKVDAKRSRLDLMLSVAAPVLEPYEDGPFTLYREVDCRVELEIELPRELVKSKNVDEIENGLANILQRYATRDAAQQARDWNTRKMEDYPVDYDRTVSEHAVWKANQVNDAVQAKMDRAIHETTRLADRVSADPEYLTGFAQGVEAARSMRLGECSQLMAVDLGRRAGYAATSDVTQTTRGYQDGRTLVVGLELLRRLPDCFVPVPDINTAGLRSQEESVLDLPTQHSR